MKKIDCKICGEQKLSKDCVALNKKLLGKDQTDFYCMNCLADYLDCSVDILYDKIEQFKEEGCTLF